MRIKNGSLISSFVGLSLLFPKTGLFAQENRLSSSDRTSKKTKCQFDQWKKTGVFKKTHENCLPSKFEKTVSINELDWLQVEHAGNQLFLSKLEWNGFEARSKDVNKDALAVFGLTKCNAIYCRPVEIPGGEALWISFLSDASSRDPLLDELYSREEKLI